MIYELKPEHFSLVRPLYEDLTYNLVVEWVITGNTLGRIWMDDPAQPRTALLWNWMWESSTSSQMRYRLSLSTLQSAIHRLYGDHGRSRRHIRI